MDMDARNIQFLDSYKADTAVVAELITKMTADLESIGYPRMEIDEIVIAVDEALTNAIQDTLRKQLKADKALRSAQREITVRYSISESYFDATIIDHGSGLDLPRSLLKIPDPSSNDYFKQVLDYSGLKNDQQARIMLDGKEVTLKGIGAGLKILSTFMDTIRIDFIDKKAIVSDAVSENTEGTILTIRRKRRYE